MRRAHCDTQLVYAGDRCIGVNLGYDYCAEHEWGTKELREKLGVWNGQAKDERKVFGRDRHCVRRGQNVQHGMLVMYPGDDKRRTPVNVWYTTTADDERAKSYLERWPFAWTREYLTARSENTRLNRRRKVKREIAEQYEEVSAWWDSSNFLYCTTNEQAHTALAQAWAKNDMFLGVTSSSNPFAGSGLFFATSEFATEQDWREIEKKQREYLAVWDCVRDSQVEKKLKSAGCKYYALSNPRIDDEGKLVLWLNPMDQHRNNSGWYTVDQLEQWTRGEGPVVRIKP